MSASTISSAPFTAEDKGQIHQNAIENTKQVFHDNSTVETKNSIKEQKVIPQPGSCKYLADTVQIVHCALKPLKKESKTMVNSCSEHINLQNESKGKNETLSKITASELSKKHTKVTNQELQETNNTNQSNKKLEEKNVSQNAEMTNALSSEGCLKNKVSFPKHLMSVQVSKACPTKEQITPSTLKNQISIDNKELGEIPSQARSKLQVQLSRQLERNEICVSKPGIAKTTQQQVCFTQTTSPTTVPRNHVGSPSFKAGTSLATIPIRSGLRLLSIVSTETSQNLHISKASGNQSDPFKATPRTPTTKSGLSVPPHNTSKSTSVIPQSRITRADVLSNSPKTAAMADLTRLPSTTTPQIPTVIGSPKSPTVRPQKPMVTSPKTPVTTDVVGALTSHINTPPTQAGPTSSAPNSLSTAAALYSPETPTTPSKENEFPRTPQSEPTQRTWIPPPDIDPMSQTFLRMPFTYQSLQVQCNHDNRAHVKRPMNAFMVWAKKNRSSIAKRYHVQIIKFG